MAQYLSYDGLKKYDELLKAWHAADHKALEDKLAAFIGADSDVDLDGITLADLAASKADVKDVEDLKKYIAEILGGSDADSADIVPMSKVMELINANKDAIDALNGDGEGSVDAKIDSAVTTAVADLVGGAPEALDTLKEIVDFIGGADSDAIAIADTVAKNANDIADVKDDIAGVDAKADKNADDIKAASDALVSANDRIDALEALLGADGSESDAESVLSRVDALEADHAADVKAINDRLDAIKEESD